MSVLDLELFSAVMNDHTINVCNLTDADDLTVEEILCEDIGEPILDLPIAEIEPITEPIAAIEPITESIAAIEPITESIAAIEPITESIAEIELITESIAEIELITESIAEIESITEPIAEIESITEPIAEIESITEPIAAIEPITEPIAAIEPITEPIAAIEPITNEINQYTQLTKLINVCLHVYKKILVTNMLNATDIKALKESTNILNSAMADLDRLKESINLINAELDNTKESINLINRTVDEHSIHINLLDLSTENYSTNINFLKETVNSLTQSLAECYNSYHSIVKLTEVHNTSILSHDARITSHNTSIASHDSSILSHDARITSHDSSIASHNTSIALHDSSILSHDARITLHDERITSHNTSIASHDARITLHDSSITSHDASITSHDASILSISKYISSRNLAVDSLKMPYNGLAKFNDSGNLVSSLLAISDISSECYDSLLDSLICNIKECSKVLKTNSIYTNDLTIYSHDTPVASFTPSGLILKNMLIAGVLHSDSNGHINSSLINGSDIDLNANILNSSLATLTAHNLVANSATSATPINTIDSIVLRDSYGNFSAGIITANEFRGTFNNVLPLTGGTLTGELNASNIIIENIRGKKINITSDQLILTTNLIVTGLNGVVCADNGKLINRLINTNDLEFKSISNDLLQPIKAKLVENSATSATSALIPNCIVTRDDLGGFTAGTITANLNGIASGCLSLNGGTLTNTLILCDGSPSCMSLLFSTNKTAGVYCNESLNFVNNTIQLSITPSGIQLPSCRAGVLHSDVSGNISSSLINGSDIAHDANILNSSLATLTAHNLVANSATSATPINTSDSIVMRDSLGKFSASVITANLIGDVTGNVTGIASGCLQLTGGILSGPLSVGKITSEILELNCNILTTLKSGIVKSINGHLSTDLIDLTNDVFNILPNTCTSATHTNAPNSIVMRDARGAFSASTITGNFIGTLSGVASGCLPINGGIMTGSVVLPAGASYNPSLRFAGATLSGLYSSLNSINISVNSVEIAQFDANGLTIRTLGSGLVQSLNGKMHVVNYIQNDLTSATPCCKPNTIVLRDANNCFEFRSLLLHKYVFSADNCKLLVPYRGELKRDDRIFTRLPIGIYNIRTNMELYIDSVIIEDTDVIIEINCKTVISVVGNGTITFMHVSH